MKHALPLLLPMLLIASIAQATPPDTAAVGDALLQRLTYTDVHFDHDATWSPDGKWLVFSTRNRERDWGWRSRRSRWSC